MFLVGNRYLRAFAKAGAIRPSSARTLAALRLRDSRRFRRLLRRGVLVETSVGYYAEYYLDPVKAADFRHRRRVATLIALLITASILLIFILLMAPPDLPNASCHGRCTSSRLYVRELLAHPD